MDVDGDVLNYSVSLADDSPLPNWLSFNIETRVISGTPPQDFSGLLSFKVKAADLNSEAIDEFTLEVLPVNDAPVALEDSNFEVNEDGSLTIYTSTLLSNDSDVEGDTLTLSSVSDALNGTVSLNQNGDVVFTPTANYFGNASFRYSVSDGKGGTSSATVTLAVNAVNDAVTIGQPIADQQIEEDGVWNFTLPTDSFIDVDGDITYSATLSDDTVLPSWIAFDADTQSFSGTPPQDFNGAYSLKVTATDGIAEISDVFTFTIAPVNDAPDAVADGEYSTDIDAPLVISSSELLANDTDVDGDNLTITSVENAVNGSVELDNNGDVIFTPDVGYTGAASFTYGVTDGNGASVSSEVNLTVNSLSSPVTLATPIEDQTINEDTQWNYTIDDSTFYDADGDTLTFAATLADGSDLPDWVDFNAETKTFSGTPSANFHGSLDFKVTATDEQGMSEDDFTLLIASVNDAPTARNDGAYNTYAGSAYYIYSSWLLGNDSDVDGDGLRVVSVNSASVGSVWMQNNNPVFSAPSWYSGAASFRYTISDGNGGTSSAYASLNVLPDPIIGLGGA